MSKEYRIDGGEIIVETDIPLGTLMEMEINHEENEHGSLKIRAAAGRKDHDMLLYTDWSETQITVFQKEDVTIPLFCGRIEKMSCRTENQFMVVEIKGIGETILLDREKKSQSFQNVSMTYKQLAAKVTAGYSDVNFLWKLGEDRPLGSPVIQYRETDWEFLKRICSHFHGALTADIKTGKPNFFMGMRQGKEKSLDGAEIIGKGFCGAYFENGAYEDGLPKSQGFCLEVKTKENWQMGDVLRLEGRCWRVFQRAVFWKDGELACVYRLGAKGMYYRKKSYNGNLAGLRLEGVIKRCEGESVYIQLDMDREERADYAWEWTPETNNLCCCMPEADTKAVLYLPTWDEADGRVILAAVHSRDKAGYEDTQAREFMTKHDKKMALYADRIVLEAKEGMAELAMKDASGIGMGTGSDISICAAGKVCLKGRRISAAAPLEILCRTENANMEICRDFNFYAQGGVKTIGTGKGGMKQKASSAEERDGQAPECWQSSYRAMAAVPAADLAALHSAADIADIYACGSIPKIAKGSTVIALAEVMEGRKESETSFPEAFHSMENYLLKGGYALPDSHELSGADGEAL